MSNATRQLTAIMFTDIVGYTSLMGRDEKQAMSVLKTNRDIHKRIIKKHDGRWLKEMGDGTLGSFQSVSDAVYCAGDLIVACNENNIDIRIGIHLGDVIEEDGDIFGDGVNVASRLEPLASPNQIMVSAPIHRNIKNKSGITSTFIEEKQLKNVDEPVKIYSVEVKEFSGDDEEANYVTTKKSNPFLTKRMLIGLVAVLVVVLAISYFFNPLGEDESTTDIVENADVKKSIAVLPFRDMSQGQDQEYLGDGVAEAIIDRLTRVSGLKVIGRTSSFSFKSKETDLKTIGKMLGVETILEGSVQKSGNQLRITAQLINADDASQIWSERFDREFSDVFSIQDEIAHLVVSKIYFEVPTVKKSFNTNENIDKEAYEYFLKGEHIIQTKYERSFKLEDIKVAEKMFLKAIEIDSNYGVAHAGLAKLYIKYNNRNDGPEKKNYLDLQKEHILKGYQLDPNSDYVNIVKGWIHLEFEQYDSAYHYFTKAIQLNPKDADNIVALAIFLSSRGLLHKSSILNDIAKGIDPLDLNVLEGRASNNIALGKLEKSMDDLEDVILLNPNSLNAYSLMIWIYILMDNGQINKVQDILNKCYEINKTDYSYWESIIFAASNDKENALNVRKNVPSLSYALLGMKKEFINSFLYESTKYYNDNTSGYLSIINDKYYNWIKDDPRIQELVNKEKVKYDMLKAKYGNLDFLDL